MFNSLVAIPLNIETVVPSIRNGQVTRWGTETDLIARRNLATAGELAVGLVNSIVWQFAGPNQYTNVSFFDFAFLQPLLQNSGRSNCT